MLKGKFDQIGSGLKLKFLHHIAFMPLDCSYSSLVDFIAVEANLSSRKVNKLPSMTTSFAKITCPWSLASVGPMVARTNVERRTLV